MSVLVPITMFGWIPLVLVSFQLLPARRAVIAAYLVAWLFLPVASYKLPGLADYDKITATNAGVFLGVLIFDAARLRVLRLGWIDVPMLIWCACPFVTSVVNDLGAYDGVAQVGHQVLIWGLPYLIGRLYFSSWDAMRELARGIFAGGLVYVPLCLWEIRMSPQLHAIVYGFHQHDFTQTFRGTGFRPTVFMEHGLMVGMWMAMASFVGLMLWSLGKMRSIGRIPMWIAVLALVLTTVLCKSLGALVLLATGAGVLWTVRRIRMPLPLLAVLLVPFAYIGVRATGAWSGSEFLSVIQSVNGERAVSLQVRLEAEDLLAAKARERPLFGWGGWGRYSVMRDEESNIEVIVDGLWIAVFGQFGLVGLIAVVLSILGPVVALWRHCPLRVWTHPAVLPAGVLAVILALYMIDNLMNAMVNPIYMLIAGGIPQLRLAIAAPRERVAHRPAVARMQASSV